MKVHFNFKFLIILFIGFVDYVGLGLVYPVFAVMLFDPHYHLVPVETPSSVRGAILGILFSLTPLSQFFTSQLLGAFSDVRGKRKALLLGIAAGCLGYLIAIIGIWLSSLTLIILYTILSGISDSTAAVAQSVIADISTEKNKARYFGFFNSSLGLGLMIGPFVGGKLTDLYFGSWTGYALPFIVAGIMMTINLLLVIWKFPETHHQKEYRKFYFSNQLRNVFKAISIRSLRWLFLGGFAFSFGWSFFYEFLPVLWIERFQFTPSNIGDFYGFSGAVYAFSAAILIVPLLKFFSPEKLVFLSSLFCAIFMSISSFIEDPIYIWFTTPLIVSMLAIGFPTATAVVSNQTGAHNQGEILGIFQSIQALAMGITPLLFGVFVGACPVFAVWGGVLSMLIAAFAFFAAQRRPA
jgi:MFS transporter, DHA1 family, tetracycline resistance protein